MPVRSVGFSSAAQPKQNVTSRGVYCFRQACVLLPGLKKTLRTFAGLEKNAVIVGVGSRAEIWDAARWQEYNAVNAEDADAVAAQLADMDIGI